MYHGGVEAEKYRKEYLLNMYLWPGTAKCDDLTYMI